VRSGSPFRCRCLAVPTRFSSDALRCGASVGLWHTAAPERLRRLSAIVEGERCTPRVPVDQPTETCSAPTPATKRSSSHRLPTSIQEPHHPGHPQNDFRKRNAQDQADDLDDDEGTSAPGETGRTTSQQPVRLVIRSRRSCERSNSPSGASDQNMRQHWVFDALEHECARGRAGRETWRLRGALG
jgi:hypothetical protein